MNSSYTDMDEVDYVNMILEGDASSHNSVDKNGDPNYFFFKFGNSEFNIMVDTVSVVSLITKRIAQEIELNDSSAGWSLQPNSMKLQEVSIILQSKIWERCIAMFNQMVRTVDGLNWFKFQFHIEQ